MNEHFYDLNIHSSCRTCLQKVIGTTHHDIFETPDLKMKLNACTSMPLDPDDGFPPNLCEPCHMKINDFYNFQQMCLSAMKQLQDYKNFEEKPCTESLDIDTKNSETLIMELKEAKKEIKEEDFTAEAELSNEQNKSESSSEEEAEIVSDEGEKEDEVDSFAEQNSNDEKHSSNQKRVFKGNDRKPVKNLICEICKQCFKKAETFEAHMRVHQGLKPYACPHCEKSYAGRRRLKGHIRAKHEGRPAEKFPCTEPNCERIMNSKQTLRQHIRDIHIGNGSKSKIQSYVCDECGKVLKGLHNLKKHSYQHTGHQLPHECPQCKKRYITKCKLKEHMDRHAGIRKYTCPHCGAKKSTRSELKTHINYHTKEKTYPCEFCDMVFNSIGNFGRHKRIVHQGIKDYPCSYCDKSFGKAETRKHHEMTHTGEKPHECNICHKKFIQYVALKKHTKIHLKGTKGDAKR